ncbi:hypothetical protein THAOC_28850, partial [Thalassiosira oceanica]
TLQQNFPRQRPLVGPDKSPPLDEVPIPEAARVPHAPVTGDGDHIRAWRHRNCRHDCARDVHGRGRADEETLVPEEVVRRDHGLLVRDGEGVVDDTARAAPPLQRRRLAALVGPPHELSKGCLVPVDRTAPQCEVGRDPIQPYPLREGVVPVPPEPPLRLLARVRDPELDAVVERRSRGVHQHYSRLGPARTSRRRRPLPPPLRFPVPALLETGPDAHDCPPGAARHDEGVHSPVQLITYLGSGGGVVRHDVREVLELVHEGRPYQPRGLPPAVALHLGATAGLHPQVTIVVPPLHLQDLPDPPGHVDVMAGVADTAVPNHQDAAAEPPQQVRLLARLVVRHHDDGAVAAGASEARERNARGSRGALDDDPVRPCVPQGREDGGVHFGGDAVRRHCVARRLGRGQRPPPLGVEDHAARSSVLPGPAGVAAFHLEVNRNAVRQERGDCGEADQRRVPDDGLIPLVGASVAAGADMLVMGELLRAGSRLRSGLPHHLSLSGQGRPFRLLKAAKTSRDAAREAVKAVAAAIEGAMPSFEKMTMIAAIPRVVAIMALASQVLVAPLSPESDGAVERDRPRPSLTATVFPRQFDTADDIPADLFRERSSIRGRVVRVIDGDTIRVRHTPLYPLSSGADGCRDRKLTECTISVRLYGVDAPETAKFGNPGQPYSQEAKDFVTRSVKDRVVSVKLLGRDRYSRVIGRVTFRNRLLPAHAERGPDAKPRESRVCVAVHGRGGAVRWEEGHAREADRASPEQTEGDMERWHSFFSSPNGDYHLALIGPDLDPTTGLAPSTPLLHPLASSNANDHPVVPQHRNAHQQWVNQLSCNCLKIEMGGKTQRRYSPESVVCALPQAMRQWATLPMIQAPPAERASTDQVQHHTNAMVFIFRGANRTAIPSPRVLEVLFELESQRGRPGGVMQAADAGGGEARVEKSKETSWKRKL